MEKPNLHSKVFLRKLELTDGEPMLEWMRNPGIYQYMQYDYTEQTLERCYNFIQNSWENKENIHLAITNEKKEYLGTVSLKNIDIKNRNAEFAIVISPRFIGMGIGTIALRAIMKKAFEELDLHKVYLYVRSDNKKAIRFYKKNRLEYEGHFKEHLFIRNSYQDIDWFSLRKGNYIIWKNTCR